MNYKVLNQKSIKQTRQFGVYLVIALLLMVSMCKSLWGQTVMGTISRPGFEPHTLAVYEAGNKVFISGLPSGKIYIHDGTTNALLDSVIVSGAVRAMLLHGSSAKLYVSFAGPSVWDSIGVINAATGTYIRTLTRYYNNVFQNKMVQDPNFGKIYLLCLEGLTQIDVTTDTETEIPGFGGGGIENIAVNPVTHEVFVCRLIEGELVIIDGITRTKLDTIADFGGLGVGVNWLENKVYVATGTAGVGAKSYKIYDRDTGTINFLYDLNDATTFLFNHLSNRMYTDAEVNGYSTIIEGPSDDYFNLPMNMSTTELALCHSTNHIYYVGKTFTGVLNDATQLLELIPIENPYTSGILSQMIAINQTTGRVYVINDIRLNVVTVIQDHEMMTRPPVYLGSRGFPSKLMIMDPIAKEVVDIRSAPDAFQANPTLTVRPGGGRFYVPRSSPFGSELQFFAGSGKNMFLNSFSTGGGGPVQAAVSPDGSLIYISNSSDDNVGILDAVSQSVITTVPVGDSPRGLALTPDGLKLFVANKTDNTVSAINISTQTVTSTISVGTEPGGVAINPAGTRVYVANSGSGTVSVIDAATESVIETVTVGSYPRWLASTPDCKTIYVVNHDDGTVSVIDTGTDAVIQTVTVGTEPEGIWALPDGSEVFVANSNPSGNSSVSAINTSDYSVTTVDLPTDAKETAGLTIADPTSKFAGRVTSNGDPVSGALVKATQGGGEEATVMTNAAGDYSIFNLLDGTYDIEISATGFISQSLPGQTVGIGQTTILNFNLAQFGYSISGNVSYYSNSDPIAQAVISLTGHASESTTTNTSGDYQFTDLEGGDYTVTPSKEYDVGSAISAFDAAWILQYGVGLRTFAPYQMISADVSGNGSVSAFDAAKILQWGVGIITYFPVMPDSTHFWTFVPEDFTLTMSNWMNAPDSIAYTPLNSDTTDNYVGIIYGDVSGNWSPSEGGLVARSIAGTADIRLEAESGRIGDKISIPVYLDNSSEIISMSFTIAYNPQVLKPIGASLTELTQGFIIAHNVVDGQIKVALAGSQPLNGSGAVVNLEFGVLDNESPYAGGRLEITEIVINEGSIKANIQAAELSVGSPVPDEYALHQNYPNPFNAQTVIKYQIPKSGSVILKIYNTLGHEVRTLVDEEKNAGYYSINWDGKNNEGLRVSSGIYVYRIQSGKFLKVRKMLILM